MLALDRDLLAKDTSSVHRFCAPESRKAANPLQPSRRMSIGLDDATLPHLLDRRSSTAKENRSQWKHRSVIAHRIHSEPEIPELLQFQLVLYRDEFVLALEFPEAQLLEEFGSRISDPH